MTHGVPEAGFFSGVDGQGGPITWENPGSQLGFHDIPSVGMKGTHPLLA